ncbi:hypothetical protein ACFRI7_17185 [Streptomyces sp. NPDC056716]|uniref:hypothetical protein n=1 Tax=unclassified Streptomyces TaxID=2593676 RepID=UPI0036A8D344
MPADEVAPGTGAQGARVSAGPRHAAPRKPLFTRFQVPAGKAIALAAMPTAVLMGMGFTPRLALAEDQPASLGLTADELTADEYAACLTALEDASKATEEPTEPAEEPSGPAEGATEEPAGDDLSASPSASQTSPAPAPTEAADGGSGDPQSAAGGEDLSGGTASPDPGSGDKAEPTPSPAPPGGSSPAPAQTGGGGLLDTVGDAIDGVVDGIADGLTGRGKDDPASPDPTPPPADGTDPAGPQDDGPGDDSGDDSGDDDSGEDDSAPADEPTEPTGEPAEDPTEPADEPPEEPTASPSPTPTPTTSTTPTPSAGVDLDDCPLATDDEGGVDNPLPVPDDPWYLNATSLLLKDADYQGVVEVETASGARKKVLKYVISGGTDIGDLHQTVRDEQAGATYHVQAAEGSTSTIRDGDTVMYTEQISGKLLGLIPVEFSPENPPPLNIPLLYFTDVTVVQAAQFGGDLHIPGMQMYTTPD